jgi:hypothetical protein
MKAEHRMGRNYLAHATGDAVNAVLAAAGYNFRRLLAWPAFLLSALILAIANQNLPSQTYRRLNLNLHRRLSRKNATGEGLEVFCSVAFGMKIMP